MDIYIEETPLLNFSDSGIQLLIEKRKWRKLSDYEKISQVYNFVKNEILLGFNIDDKIKASRVLSDGYGQCNTKAILFMAILRALKIPCRIHGFLVEKSLQKGLQPLIVYILAPNFFVHSWVEVFINDKWIELEGLIVDDRYLSAIQRKFNSYSGKFTGYAIAVDDLSNPSVEWNGENTYIQKNSIVKDLGIFYSPDEFLKQNQQDFSKVKKFLYRNLGRKLMNKKAEKIRLY